uniref:Uncharacterized protein n=1 Tax=Brassica oleracea var. oleracea TaxID=109376 RepID=A0A0D3AJX3_BRAOL
MIASSSRDETAASLGPRQYLLLPQNQTETCPSPNLSQSISKFSGASPPMPSHPAHQDSCIDQSKSLHSLE